MLEVLDLSRAISTGRYNQARVYLLNRSHFEPGSLLPLTKKKARRVTDAEIPEKGKQYEGKFQSSVDAYALKRTQ